jgi:hypothetical protein
MLVTRQDEAYPGSVDCGVALQKLRADIGNLTVVLQEAQQEIRGNVGVNRRPPGKLLQISTITAMLS